MQWYSMGPHDFSYLDMVMTTPKMGFLLQIAFLCQPNLVHAVHIRNNPSSRPSLSLNNAEFFFTINELDGIRSQGALKDFLETLPIRHLPA